MLMLLIYDSDADLDWFVVITKYVPPSKEQQREMRAVLVFLYISVAIPVIRGTLSKTDAKKNNQVPEPEVSTLWNK